MAEIRLDEGFLAEVKAFQGAGEQLDVVSVNSVSADGLSLQTVEAYQERLWKIWTVMFKFYLLTKKDAADMNALAERLKAADSSGC